MKLANLSKLYTVEKKSSVHKNRDFVYIILLALWLVMAWFVPLLAVIIMGVNLLALLSSRYVQFFSAGLQTKLAPAKQLRIFPKVSVHVPTYNEPPEIVAETIKALTKLSYPNYEVIVLDNNTKDPEVWRPIQKLCATLGPNFKFQHIDELSGFKAGALNVCYNLSHPDTEYILVIDADYCVSPNLLNEALTYFTGEEVSLVQFPQAYVNSQDCNIGLTEEYNHFFKVYMNMANHYNCVLSTGTVSVIRKSALEKVGLWSGQTITEDCELGLRFHQHGYRGVYVPKPLGKGLMPTDLKALKVQRERWVFGNMQTLRNFVGNTKHKLRFTQRIGIATQLTAWFSFLLVSVLATVTGVVFYKLQAEPVYLMLSWLGVGAILFELFSKYVFFSIALRHSKNTLAKAWHTFLVNTGLAWEGATSWLRCLLGENIRFKRTNKFLGAVVQAKILPNLTLFIALLIAGILALTSSFYFLGGLSIVASLPFLSVFYLKNITRKTYQLAAVPKAQKLSRAA